MNYVLKVQARLDAEEEEDRAGEGKGKRRRDDREACRADQVAVVGKLRSWAVIWLQVDGRQVCGSVQGKFPARRPRVPPLVAWQGPRGSERGKEEEIQTRQGTSVNQESWLNH